MARCVHDERALAWRRAAASAGLFALALMLLVPQQAAAQQDAGRRPSVTQLSAPESDADTARLEAANERVAAFLIAEAREELGLGELRSARRRLEILVTRYGSTSVAIRARRMLEQLAAFDGFPVPPIAKSVSKIDPTPPTPSSGGPLATRAPGTSLMEADFSASGGDRLFFADGSDEVGGRGMRILREKADWLRRNGKVFLRIEGHSDDLGNDDRNSALALRRAETVRDLLVDAGVPATRMHIAAFGRESRIAPCTAPSCAAQNRRAILVLTDARGARLSAPSQQAAAAEPASGPTLVPAGPGPGLRRDR